MKLIIAGNRDIKDYDVVKEAINCLLAQGLIITTIIDGAARGVDTLASRYALEHNIENIRIHAEWKLYHQGAGPIRNQKVAEMGDALLAIWDGKSRGTKNMIACARKKGLSVYIKYVT